MCPDNGAMEITAVRSGNEQLCTLLARYTGFITSEHTEVYNKTFAFAGVDGYQCGGMVTNIEYHPDQFFRLWSDHGFHVEWRPEGSCTVHAPFRVTGIPGSFSFTD